MVCDLFSGKTIIWDVEIILFLTGYKISHYLKNISQESEEITGKIILVAFSTLSVLAHFHCFYFSFPSIPIYIYYYGFFS